MTLAPSHLALGGIYCYPSNQSETRLPKIIMIDYLTILWRGGRRSAGWSCYSHSGSPRKGSKGWQRWLKDGTLSLPWKHTVSMGSSGFSRGDWTPRGSIHSTRQTGQRFISIFLFLNLNFTFFYHLFPLCPLPSPPIPSTPATTSLLPMSSLSLLLSHPRSHFLLNPSPLPNPTQLRLSSDLHGVTSATLYW